MDKLVTELYICLYKQNSIQNYLDDMLQVSCILTKGLV
jgi:hypothetical protein